MLERLWLIMLVLLHLNPAFAAGASLLPRDAGAPQSHACPACSCGPACDCATGPSDREAPDHDAVPTRTVELVAVSTPRPAPAAASRCTRSLIATVGTVRPISVSRSLALRCTWHT